MLDKDSPQYEQALVDLCNDLDQVILKWQTEFEPHNITGVMLSRITLLMTHDPATAKGLLQFVWDKFDQIEQANPGDWL
jgi:hypothetical protein